MQQPGGKKQGRGPGRTVPQGPAGLRLRKESRSGRSPPPPLSPGPPCCWPGDARLSSTRPRSRPCRTFGSAKGAVQPAAAAAPSPSEDSARREVSGSEGAGSPPAPAARIHAHAGLRGGTRRAGAGRKAPVGPRNRALGRGPAARTRALAAASARGTGSGSRIRRWRGGAGPALPPTGPRRPAARTLRRGRPPGAGGRARGGRAFSLPRPQAAAAA